MRTRTQLAAVAISWSVCSLVFPARADPWTLTSAPSNYWSRIVSSADGTRIVGLRGLGDYIYASTNSGATWFQTGAPSNIWKSVACSADGNKLVASTLVLGAPGGHIYTSADGGVSWNLTSAPTNLWTSVAASADGTKLVAATGTPNPRGIYVSTNSGVTWTSTVAPGNSWKCVVSSADGTKLAAGADGGLIYCSTNAGANWMPTSGPDKLWNAIASSADGTRLAAVGGGYFRSTNNNVVTVAQTNTAIFTSSNSGATWSQSGVRDDARWYSIASSADGNKLIAHGWFGPIYTSTNAGTSWTSNGVPSGNWSSVASSADGNKLVASVFNGGIYTTQSTPTPLLSMTNGGDHLLLSWVIPSVSLSLEQNTDLLTTDWMDAQVLPVLNLALLRYEAVVLRTNVQGFYRLKNSGPYNGTGIYDRP